MKILIADPDRDFLQSFKKHLECCSYEIDTAFDGTQVIRKITETSFDMVLLGQNIPRVPWSELVRQLNEKKIPSIVMLREKVNSDLLRARILPNAYISFPFFPNELYDLVNQVAEKTDSDEKLSFGEVEVNVSGFILMNKIRVTNGEINIMKTLSQGKEINPKRAGPFINSINNKLTDLGSKIRIKYVMKQGYRMVTVYE